MAVAGLYLALTVALFHKALFASHGAVGYEGDPLLFQWYLGLGPACPGPRNQPPVLQVHQHQRAAARTSGYYTSVPLAGLVLWPLTALGGTLLSYNTLMVASLCASAFAAYAMCTRFVTSRTAAVVGGAIYGFSPYMVAQSVGHPQMTMGWFPPVVVIVADKVVRGHQSPVRLGLLFGIAATAQILLGTEFLVTTILVAGGCVAVWLTVFRHEPGAKALRVRGEPALLVAVGTLAVLGCFPIYMLAFGGHRVGVSGPCGRDLFAST